MKSKKQATSAKTTAKKGKKTLRKASTQPPPTKEEVAKALATRKALAGDILRMKSLKLEEEEEDAKFEPIVFSDTWYEFSVLCFRLKMSTRTVNRWLDNGWIAYSKLGRFRIINKFDFEDTMRHFRKPARFPEL